MESRLKNLDHVFNARSLAFVGASEQVNKWGYIIFKNLLDGKFEGKIYPVNPGRESVLGLKAYPSVLDIPGEIDLAVFTIPAKFVEGALDDCAKKGVKGAVVISAGFGELGALGGEYVDMQKRIADKARAADIVLIGPNGQGVCCPETKLYPWIPPNFHPPGGEVAVVAQSGTVQTLMIGSVVKAGFGVSKSASSGNEADLKIGDYLEYFAQDDATKVILAYVEGITEGRKFIEQARAASRMKPVVIFKGGATESGIAAAQSHTGAMAVGDDLFESVCRQAGIIRVDRLDEAGAIACSFLNRPLPRGNRVAILTGGGGLGVVAADVCTKIGLDIVKLSDETLGKIGEYMPDWWVPGNPVDMVAGLRHGTRGPIMEILMKSGEIDALMLPRMGPPRNVSKKNKNEEAEGGPEKISKLWEAMSKRQADLAIESFDLMHKYGVPAYMASNMFVESGIDIGEFMGEKKFTVYQNIDSACQSIKAMADYQKYISEGK